MPDTDAAAAIYEAERLRIAIAAEPIEVGGHRFFVTVSMGVAELHDRLSALTALLDAADSALYMAKRAGRNQVCMWEPIY